MNNLYPGASIWTYRCMWKHFLLVHQGFFLKSIWRQVYAYESGLGEGPLLCGCIYCILSLYTHKYSCLCFVLVFGSLSVWTSKCMACPEAKLIHGPLYLVFRIWHMTCTLYMGVADYMDIEHQSVWENDYECCISMFEYMWWVYISRYECPSICLWVAGWRRARNWVFWCSDEDMYFVCDQVYGSLLCVFRGRRG